MARNSNGGEDLKLKYLPRSDIDDIDIEEHFKKLQQAGDFRGNISFEPNPYAVRINAAETDKEAYEYQKEDGTWAGMMTERLVDAILEGQKNLLSWRTTMIRIREILKHKQTCTSSGPDRRLHFSMEEVPLISFHITREDNVTVLQAGKVMGVYINDIYAIMPLTQETFNGNAQLAEVRVIDMLGFKSHVEFLKGRPENIPKEGALAFLRSQTRPIKWKIELGEALRKYTEVFSRSDILQCDGSKNKVDTLMNCIRYDEKIILYTTAGTQLASTSFSTEGLQVVLRAAEQLARAQHLLNLTCDDSGERLMNHGCRVIISRQQEGGSEQIIEQDGTGRITAGDFIRIKLRNDGAQRVYASLFDINVAGKITLLTDGSPSGEQIDPGREFFLRERPLERRGVRPSWPINIPKIHPVTENLTVVVTDEMADLRKLESSIEIPSHRDIPRGTTNKLIRYDIIHINLILDPPAEQLPEAAG